MRSNFGFNCRRQPTARILEAIDRTNAGLVLVSNEPKQANEIVVARPDVLVIAREYWPAGGDDNLHTKLQPTAWVNWMNGRGYDPRVVWNVGNEPTTDLAGLANWTLQAMREADKLGRSLCVLNFALLNPDAIHWSTTLAPVLDALDGSNHYLGLHEYHWWNRPTWAGDPVGNYKEVYKACDFLGINYPRILITESGVEKMFGSWANCGMSPDAFADLQLGIHQGYAKDGIASCLFSLGEWFGDEKRQNNYDVWPALDALSARTWPAWHRDAVPEPPAPEPEPEPVPEIPHNPDIPISNRRNFLTYNVTSVAIDREPGQRQWLDDWLEAARPAGLMVMGALQEAVQYKQRYPDMFVWARMPDGVEGGDGSKAEIDRRGGYKVCIDEFRKQTGGADIAYAIVNEIHTTDEHGAWMLDVIKYANEVGQRLVEGEFGIAQTVSMWHRGSPWVEVARLMETSTPRHVWGFHEYFDFGTWQWEGYDPMRGERFMVGNASRHAQFLLDNYGIDMRNNGVVFGECGPDTVQGRDCQPYAPGVPMKGYRDAYCPPNAEWVKILEQGEWPAEWIPPRALWANMHGALHHVWKANDEWHNLYIAGAWYMYAGGMAYDDNGQPIAPGSMWGFDIWGNPDYRKRHYKFGVGEQMTKTYKVAGTDSLRVRSAPSLQGVRLGWLQPGTVVEMDDTSEVLTDGYYWLKHTDTSNGERWSARINASNTWVFLEVVEQPQDPPDEPEPEPEPEPGEPFTDDQRTVLAGLINVAVADAMQQQQATIAAAVDEALKPYRLWAKTVADASNSLAGYTTEDAA